MDVYKELSQLLGKTKEKTQTSKTTIWRSILDLMSESMSPILQPLMAAGMLLSLIHIC